jgi:hypothetical protein
LERSFPTKTGTCTITNDEIVLHRSGVRGTAAELMVGRRIGATLFRYGLIGLVFLFLAVQAFDDAAPFRGVLYLAVSGFFLYGVASSWNNSATPVIPRAAIRSITGHPPRPLLTRGYFSVYFAEGERVRRRLIMLPSRIRDARVQYDDVSRLMRECGLQVS